MSEENVEDNQAAGGGPHPRISTLRLWSFRIIALVVIPVLVLVLLEVTLRLIGYGYPADAIVKSEFNGQVVCRDNVKFGWRFFPRNISWELTPFVFPADKPANTYRVFVLGASAANGEPDEAYCFGRFLRIQLRQQYPTVNFEVITVAMPAINSHVVLEVAKSCAQCQPDLFVVYLGNNEVVGPYGPGTVFSRFSTSLPLVRFAIAVKATRVGQLLADVLELASGKRSRVINQRGLEMFLEKQIRADDGRMDSVYRYFESNVRDICLAAYKAKAKTILCTVGSNLKDCPPFACLHKPGLTEADKQKWDEIYQQAVKYESDGNYTEAVERYLAAEEIDDCYAELHFRLGRSYLQIGEYDSARQRYVKARELDTLRLRTNDRINEIVRRISGERASEGVYLADAVKIFEQNSPYGVCGEELFYEHVHLNFRGNYLLAKAVFEEVEKILPEQIKSQKASERSLLTEAECARNLAYTGWDQYKIALEVLDGFIKKAPFTNQLDHDKQVRKLEEKLEKLKEENLKPEALEEADAQYRLAIESDRDDWFLRWKYAKLLVGGLGFPEAAIEQYRLVLGYLDYYAAYGSLGGLFGVLGDTHAVIVYNLKALRINPNCAGAHSNLALACFEQGQIDKAIAHYCRALLLQPNYLPRYNEFGAVLYEQGKIDDAVKLYRRGVRLMPGSVMMHYNLGMLLYEQGQRREAIKEFRTALKLEPNSVEIRSRIEKLLR